LAIYHCSVKTISRSQGRSATGAAAYRAGEKILDERTGLTHDYTQKNGVDHTEILAPENAPSWVQDRSILWNQAEHAEKRKDSRLCREIEVALPVELSTDQSRDLVKGFIQSELVSKGMISDLAIHHEDGENPHAHILLTTRDISSEGFGKKNRDWDKKDHLESWRVSWEKHANKALEKAGHEVRIDHRTLEAQGIERVPQIHIGAKVFEMERRGVRTERGERAVEIEETNEKISLLQERKEATEHERNHEIKKRQDDRRTREQDRTNGRSFCDSLGSSERAPESTTERKHSTRENMDGNPDSNSQELGDSDERPERGRDRASSFSESCSARDTKLETQTSDDLLDHFNDSYSGAFDRIIDLARPSNRDAGERDMDRTEDKQLDRTYLATRRQLKAMSCDKYDIGIRSRDGKMMTRTWSEDEVLKSVSWLKRENAKGADIYVRPAGEKNQGIILVDDVTKGNLERMKSSGLEPAAVIETSPHNYQAWVRLSKDPLTPALATDMSKGIAKRFEADPNSADWRHFGRLSGFTNRKPEHTTAQGRNPWVLCHESSGNQASRGDEFVKTISKQISNVMAQKEKETRLRSAENAPQGTDRYNPIRTYQSNLKSLTERYGADMDLSRADFMICSKMAQQGFTAKQLTETLQKASPELPIRKAGHESDYCQRTVKAVFSSPQVQEHLKQQERDSQQRDRGFSR